MSEIKKDPTINKDTKIRNYNEDVGNLEKKFKTLSESNKLDFSWLSLKDYKTKYEGIKSSIATYQNELKEILNNYDSLNPGIKAKFNFITNECNSLVNRFHETVKKPEELEGKSILLDIEPNSWYSDIKLSKESIINIKEIEYLAEIGKEKKSLWIIYYKVKIDDKYYILRINNYKNSDEVALYGINKEGMNSNDLVRIIPLAEQSLAFQDIEIEGSRSFNSLLLNKDFTTKDAEDCWVKERLKILYSYISQQDNSNTNIKEK